MQRATLTSKGQTTIPVAVREKLGLRPGDRLIFEERDGAFVIRRDPGLDDLVGCLAGSIQRRHDPAMTGQQMIDLETAVAEAAWAADGASGADPKPSARRQAAG